MNDLVAAYKEFSDELLHEAQVSGEPLQACFFKFYSELAATNGDCLDLAHTPVRKEGAYGYQIDGYALDVDRGELYLAICDFRTDDELQVLNQAQIDNLCNRAEKFLKMATSPEYVVRLEETGPAFEAAYPIYSKYSLVKRIRIIILSNARFVARKKNVESKEYFGKTLIFNLLDFTRYTDILDSGSSPEPTEIDFSELHGSSLPCLRANTGSTNYASFLIVMPGDLLAKIYGLYGACLLEQNVRTFLQAKTKVNQGIITTIEKNPEMFFAYNNGLTATAGEVEIEEVQGGISLIRSVKNLQIVNGGQTTASILYAKDMKNSDLSQVFVQMKLSVLIPDKYEEVVPKISRFANTQNKISDADFFSTHPFHIEIEKISRRISAPQKEGAFIATKWFYERARGQYKSQISSVKGSDKKKFETQNPAEQVIVKTDLAKYVLTFDRLPHIVSQGAQKCFLKFADKVGEEWKEKPLAFNEGYFKEVVAMTIIFRWTDQMVALSQWYKDDRGYKAQIVTYTIAWFVNYLKKIGKESIDLQHVWNKQDVDADLKRTFELIAPAVANKIKDAPANVKNVGEYCKQQACWAAVSGLQIIIPTSFKNSLIDADEIKHQRKDNCEVKKIDSTIEFESKLIMLIPYTVDINKFANSMKLLSPKSNDALQKLSAANINLSMSEKNALKYLFDKMTELGYEFPA